MCRNNDDYIIEIQNACKLYGAGKQDASKLLTAGQSKDDVYRKTGVTAALWDINLKIKRGEIFVIIGLSGSGKSTLVRCINRLNKLTTGKVLIDGVDLESLSKQELLELRRNKISMVFQSFGLMSHRDILGNVSYGLEVKGVSKEEREKKSKEVISMVGLEGLEGQSCSQLSGGMRQRVGIARALANDPEVLLMDEPFSALDPLVRSDMQFELLSIQRKLEKTVIFITHDIDEAFKLGDTVAIMRDGRLIQVDTPQGMSANPADDYVRRFIDSADKSKVLTAANIMIKPSSIVKKDDTVNYALHEMRKNALSSVYMVDERLKFMGIVTVVKAIEARRDEKLLYEIVEKIPTCRADALVADIMPIAAESPYPIAVTDEKERLMGIVTKATVLTSLI